MSEESTHETTRVNLTPLTIELGAMSLPQTQPLLENKAPKHSLDELVSGPYVHNILQNKETSRATKSAQLAARTLDIAADILAYRGDQWPQVHEFEQKYELAHYLWQTRAEDETAILLEIMDEAFEEAPDLHKNILKLSQKVSKQLKLYNEAQVADVMVKLWVVDEIEPDLPCSYEKSKHRAKARANRPTGFTPRH